MRLCPFSKEKGGWTWPTRGAPPSPAGRHSTAAHGGVAWGIWGFTITQRPSSGLALDVRFRGVRVLFELAMQDAQAACSGSRVSQFFYADGALHLSILSASLEPGMDCPEDAHYLAVPRWYRHVDGDAAVADPTAAADFLLIFVLTWEEGHAILRQNSGPPEVTASLGRLSCSARWPRSGATTT